ncbi:putative 40S ribosomal protein S10 [Chiua virens]|nr:putative 40S ribosomal protein S10 [Chiua virens]
MAHFRLRYSSPVWLQLEYIVLLDVKTRLIPSNFNVTGTMLISKQNRRTIYENLFKEGVLVAKKDFNAPKHEDIDVPNLEVIKAMQSLSSKGLVKTQFSWQWYYYVLTPEGVDYLREWLHLPNEIVPATHKRAARPPRPATVRPGGEGGPRQPRWR